MREREKSERGGGGEGERERERRKFYFRIEFYFRLIRFQGWLSGGGSDRGGGRRCQRPRRRKSSLYSTIDELVLAWTSSAISNRLKHPSVHKVVHGKDHAVRDLIAASISLWLSHSLSHSLPLSLAPFRSLSLSFTHTRTPHSCTASAFHGEPSTLSQHASSAETPTLNVTLSLPPPLCGPWVRLRV